MYYNVHNQIKLGGNDTKSGGEGPERPVRIEDRHKSVEPFFNLSGPRGTKSQIG